MRKGKGFTLAELMITIAVAAILATIAIPSFQFLIQSSRVSTQTNEFVTGINAARSEAVRRNGEVIVTPDGDWSTGFRVIDADGNTIRVFDSFGAGMSLDNDASDNDDITFLGDGTRGTDASLLPFGLQPDGECLGDARRVITITASGSTRTEVQTCS